MVLTRLKGDEPHTTALERQVQTLAAAVERLTKQNHDLEEQPCQRNAGPKPNNHKEKQEGTNVKGRTKKDQKIVMP